MEQPRGKRGQEGGLKEGAKGALEEVQEFGHKQKAESGRDLHALASKNLLMTCVMQQTCQMVSLSKATALNAHGTTMSTKKKADISYQGANTIFFSSSAGTKSSQLVNFLMQPSNSALALCNISFCSPQVYISLDINNWQQQLLTFPSSLTPLQLGCGSV